MAQHPGAAREHRLAGPPALSARGHALRLLAAMLLIGFAACATAPAPPAKAVPARVIPQADWSDAVLYFVLLDRYADGDPANNADVEPLNPGGWHGGDLAGLAAQLDDIASLGATAIWINPVVKQVPAPVGAQDFQHWPFHGYWADDFTRLDEHFGSEAELKALVDAAHARGLKVLLDVVYNHVGYNAGYLAPATRHWIRPGEGNCEVDPLTCRVGGLPDLRTELPEVREHLFAAHLGLARRTGLDGFRLDTVKHVEHDFWQAHRARTRAELGAGFFLLGEVWGGSHESLDEWFAPDEMDAGFDFTFRGSCRAYVEGQGRTVAYAAYLASRHRVRDGHHLVHYLSSHDEPLALHELRGDTDKLKLCVVLQMTSAGIPMIYYGEEVGRRGGAWPTNRDDMPWGARNVPPAGGGRRDEALRDYYRRLIALRRAHPALATGAFRLLAAEGDLLVYAREHEASGDTVIVAVNRGTSPAAARVPLPARWRAVREGLAGAGADVRDGALVLGVPPRTAHVYVGD